MYSRRLALFVLRDNNGRVVLQHRDKDAPRLPDYWAFFGGHMEKSESPEEAVRREAKEELGIELEGPRLFKRYEFKEEDGMVEKHMFVADLKNRIEDLKNQQAEGQNLGIFSFDELKRLKISKNDIVILKELFGR
jgi:8-oxo-dGTP diphosphatase